MKIISIITCFLSLTVTAQNENSKPEREAFKLVLEVDKKSTYESEIKASSYLNGPNVLQLYPGEKIFIEVEEADGSIRSMQSVKENIHPEKTIEVSFAQNASKKKHENMMLTIKNPFKYDLTYSAKILLMTQNKWVTTKVLPVRATISSFEIWPDIIVSIGLGEWLLVKD